MKKTRRTKISEKSMKRYLKEILQAQEKGEFEIALPFDKDGNLFIVITGKAVIENPINQKFQNGVLAILWAFMEGKGPEDVESGKDYKKEIEKHMPELIDTQKKGKTILSLLIDDNANFRLKVFGIDAGLPPFRNIKDLDYLRYMLLIVFLAEKNENFLPIMENLSR